MRNWIACLSLAISVPGAVSAQSVNYQSQLLLGEIVLNISGSGSYTQRGNIVYLSGQMVSDAASAVDADALNQQNFDMLINSLGTMGVSPTQIRKTKLAPSSQPTAGQARSVWQIYIDLYDQTRLGEVISSMEGAEVRSIQPPQYDVTDRNALLTFARQRAIDDAKRQAEAYATALTMVVRRITRIEEVSSGISTTPKGGTANEGDVVANANVKVDIVFGPMFNSAPAPATP
ncbi:SIMPL domain-containing protein [Sphingorhabdus sp.]|uniref:SIMPL domain-containing protein n=1 Tax=Sphingorhabdus sp. TaxID=1902408 RepID=UPI0032B80717